MWFVRVHAYFIMPLCAYISRRSNAKLHKADCFWCNNLRLSICNRHRWCHCSCHTRSSFWYVLFLYCIFSPKTLTCVAKLMPSLYIWLALVFFIFFFSEYLRHEEGENCNPNFTRMVCWGWGWCLIHLQLYHLIFKHACKWCGNNILLLFVPIC